MEVTGKTIKALAPNLTLGRAEEIAVAVNKSASTYKVKSTKALAAILSQIAHESAGFTAKNESLNYSEESLKATFSYYRLHPQLAAEHGRTPKHAANQQLIANTVYADKNRDEKRKLGNVNPNDGWFFRGGGPMMLTGRDVYTQYAVFKGESVVTIVEKVRTSDEYGMDSAFWFFIHYKQLLDEAEAGDIKNISRAVAGTLIGLDKRVALYNKALTLLK